MNYTQPKPVRGSQNSIDYRKAVDNQQYGYIGSGKREYAGTRPDDLQVDDGRAQGSYPSRPVTSFGDNLQNEGADRWGRNSLGSAAYGSEKNQSDLRRTMPNGYAALRSKKSDVNSGPSSGPRGEPPQQSSPISYNQDQNRNSQRFSYPSSYQQQRDAYQEHRNGSQREAGKVSFGNAAPLRGSLGSASKPSNNYLDDREAPAFSQSLKSPPNIEANEGRASSPAGYEAAESRYRAQQASQNQRQNRPLRTSGQSFGGESIDKISSPQQYNYFLSNTSPSNEYRTPNYKPLDTVDNVQPHTSYAPNAKSPNRTQNQQMNQPNFAGGQGGTSGQQTIPSNALMGDKRLFASQASVPYGMNINSTAGAGRTGGTQLTGTNNFEDNAYRTGLEDDLNRRDSGRGDGPGEFYQSGGDDVPQEPYYEEPEIDRDEPMTREEYDDVMQQIWSGEGDERFNERYNSQILQRAKNRLYREADNRQMIRTILYNDPLLMEYKDRTRAYREAMNRAVPTKELWDRPPADYKGTQHQWIWHKEQEALDAKVHEEGRRRTIEEMRVQYQRTTKTVDESVLKDQSRVNAQRAQRYGYPVLDMGAGGKSDQYVMNKLKRRKAGLDEIRNQDGERRPRANSNNTLNLSSEPSSIPMPQQYTQQPQQPRRQFTLDKLTPSKKTPITAMKGINEPRANVSFEMPRQAALSPGLPKSSSPGPKLANQQSFHGLASMDSFNNGEPMNLLKLVKVEDRLNIEQVIAYIKELQQCQQRVKDPKDDIEAIFTKILKWKKRYGDLEQQEQIVAKKLSNSSSNPVEIHNVKTLKEKLAEFSGEVGFTQDEVTILIFTSLDHGWLTNLLVLPGEFMKWFEINFEGENREEMDFLLSKLTIWKSMTTNAQYIMEDYNFLKSNNKELLCDQRYWEKLRFQKIGQEIGQKFKAAPKLMKELRLLFKAHDDKCSYFDFFQFLEKKLKLGLANWEEDDLESRLDRLGMAFIEFNELNEFSIDYDINWGEQLLETDIEDQLDAKLNVSYKRYKLSKADYFMGSPSILTSEKAALALVDQIYQDLKRKKVKRFLDLDFGPQNKQDILGSKFAMYKTGEARKGCPEPEQCEWVFADSLCPQGSTPEFISGGVASSDCVQGQLGDCWFISAMSVLATRDELIRGGRAGMEYDPNMIVGKGIAYLLSQGVYPPIFHKYRTVGLYVLRFFKNFQWIYVIIDSRIVVDKKKKQPVFGHCKDPSELWVPLIEKAYAKLHGCYENLVSGYVDEGIQELTGFQPEKVPIKNEKVGTFPSKMIQLHYGGEHGFWKFIYERDQDNCLMGCSIKGDGKEGPHILDGRPSGLILNHAYGITDIIEFKDPYDKKQQQVIRLLRLRNPWGKSEWLGAWAGDSPEMINYGQMIQGYINSLPPDEQFDMDADDGTFFMNYEDWRDSFSTLFLNNDFPDQWTGVRFMAEWTLQNSGGLPVNYKKENLDRYGKNPQFLIKAATDTELMFSMSQTGGRLPPATGEYYNYPFVETLHYGCAAVFKLPKGQEHLQSFNKEQLVLLTPIKRERENSGRCTLLAGQSYVIVCCTELAGKLGKFHLSIYFNQRLRDVAVKRVFAANDKQHSTDETLPRLIPEEAEKTQDQTPIWKIKLVKESLGYMMTDEDVK